jgi:hypothetical protein
MAADADTPVTVGGAPIAAASPGAAPAADPDTPVSITPPSQDPDAPVSIGGEAVKPRTGFWHDFGGATGGVWGLVKAPVTSSIPAEEIKGLWREGHEHPEEVNPSLTGLFTLAASMGVRKAQEFMASDDRKPLKERMRESFGAIVDTAKKNPGLVAGSLVKGLVADPELFLLPGASGVGTAARVAKTAETLGAGAKAAQAAGAVAGGAARAGTAAAIGGGAEVAREFGEDAPLDPGAIATSALISTPFGFTQIPTKLGEVKLKPEEIDAILTPSATTTAKPDVKVNPTADGYQVRVEGQEGTTFPTKAAAEEAARQISETSSAYRVMDTVPRGANERTAALQDNPFTPEKMAEMVQRPKGDHAMTGKELASYLGKAAIGAGIGAGIGGYLDKDDPKTGATFGALITLVPRALEQISPKGSRITIEDAVNERNGQIAVMARKTLQFKTAIDAAVPEPLRRTAISLYMEGGALGQSIKLNPEELKVAQSARDFFDAMGNTAVDAGVLKELLNNYVSHIVEEDPDAQARATVDKIVDVLMNRTKGRQGAASGRQFAQQRQYATFEELQAALRGSNLKIRTGDIGEIMAIYSKAMFRTITDKRLIDALKATPVEEMGPMLMPPQDPAVPGAGPLLERAPLEGEAGAVQPKLTDGVPDPNLPAASGGAPTRAGAGGEGGGNADSSPPGFPPLPPDPGPGIAAQKFAANQRNRMLLQPQDKADGNYVTLPNRQLSGFAVHKDIAPQLNFIFSARDPNDVTIGLMALNQASKRAIVSFSLFHAKSLSDAFIGAMGGTKAGLNPRRAIAEALAQFKKGGGNDGIDALLKNGLNLQLPEDVSTDHLTGALNRVAAIVDKALPITPAASAVKGISAFNNALDHFTFTTLQAGFKLVTGLDAYERLIKKGLPTDKAARLAASYTNDIYGGLDWFRVANDVGSRIGRDAAYGFFNPNGRRWAQILMFAPDWTFSTFRAAYKALPGAVDDPALAALHRRYLVKSAIYYLTIANSINLITAGHSVFQNENPTRVQLGDGRTMQFSKHFMEPAEWLRDPIQTTANKLAFIPREAVEQLTGKEYVSAHDAAPEIKNRAEHFAQQFLPINAQQGLAGGGAESLLGLVGMPIYGKTPEQKREAKKEKKLAEIEKKKATARYYQRLHN